MKIIIFIICSIFIFNGVAFFIPKRMTKSEIYNSALFVLLLQIIVDIIFDLEYDFYGYFNKGVDLISLLIFPLIYPAFNIVLLNYFPFGKKLIYKIVYILGSTAFCLFYEWLTVKFGFFYHNDWTFIYSAFSYPLLIIILALNLLLNRKLSGMS